ncbi:MAG: ABC transporter ATP-binding protein [Rhodocyclaceae bacterium]|nr:putative ABC transporter ATP-binding protein YheS [Rhodocyclaceae bacterium]MCQ3923531.1 ABC transporter ATP-binding protein [Rhodocyclaceae bacterium]HNQ56360.1 ATP-binding cassette domain-containing protein [Candidatus Desulfobacillus denitrificans]HNT64046.1 ATP-binding cassette domain-containing protein [Candidatus Desulfobacillus denitrificans]
MILLRNLTLARAGRPLIEDVSLGLHAGWKVGVTGANGCGKSSLFALFSGDLHQEAGDLELPPQWVIAHVGQETPALATGALDFTLDGDAELRRIEADLRAAEEAHDGEAIAHLHMDYGNIDGYSARARAAALLHGLGFKDEDFERPVAEFSGGWRVRLNLAQALMCRSDLLLLDEPTNHLDLDAVIWLEGWLRAYRGTLLMISHDRDFLDAVVGHVIHIEGRRAKLYTGNYSAFERARAEQLALQQAMYVKQQREIAHLKSYIDRFRAKATKARQAQSRIKALARMEEVTAAHVDTPFEFRFFEPVGSPDPLLMLEDAAAGYGDIAVLQGLTLTLRPGERLGLLGRNGAGKSTLIRLLAGEAPPLAGIRHEGKGLKIGYFAQHQLEQLRPDESPLWHMNHLDSRTRDQDFRNYLGGFNFHGEMATRPVGPFSGGEKSRLALALLIWQKPNLLLLDEPTNHLDLEMRHALTLALSEYEGAVVLVSHDRHLLRTVCDNFCLVADGGLKPFDGDLDDYRKWLDQPHEEKGREKVSPPDTAKAAPPPAPERKPSGKARALEKEIGQLEKRMAQLATEKQKLDARLVDPEFYQPAAKADLQACQQRQIEVAGELAETEAAWLAAQEKLEKSE